MFSHTIALCLEKMNTETLAKNVIAADAASEIVEQVVEQAVAKAPKKETWISTLFRWFS